MQIMNTIIQHIDDLSLSGLHTRLKRTRRKVYPFGLNGRTIFPTRKQAIEAVVAEIAGREDKTKQAL